MKRILGKTNIEVNEIGFGGIPVQRVSQNDVYKIVDSLIENQINLIDTARGYTVSEEYLGNALFKKRDRFVLCTKSMSRSYSEMKRDIEISLKNLKTDYIDLYQLHNLKKKEEYELVISENGAYRALKEAQAEGKIRFIGITSHSYEFLDSIIEDCRFDTIQFPYNILEIKAEPLFEKAKKKNIGVIAMKPLAGGAIDDARLGIKFILNNPNISVAIPGMDSVLQVNENAKSKAGEYSSDELNKIKQIRNELGENFCRRCGYCLPCTKGIDIPSCFMFEGYLTRYHLKEWAESRYSLLTHHASECIACGKCETRCPYHLPIIQKLKKVSELFKR